VLDVGSGDGAAANAAQMSHPTGLAVDAAGNVYIADTTNGVIRKVTTDGNINTIAGLGPTAGGFAGDGSAATAAYLWGPLDVAVDSSSNIFVADWGNHLIRKIH